MDARNIFDGVTDANVQNPSTYEGETGGVQTPITPPVPPRRLGPDLDAEAQNLPEVGLTNTATEVFTLTHQALKQIVEKEVQKALRAQALQFAGASNIHPRPAGREGVSTALTLFPDLPPGMERRDGDRRDLGRDGQFEGNRGLTTPMRGVQIGEHAPPERADREGRNQGVAPHAQGGRGEGQPQGQIGLFGVDLAARPRQEGEPFGNAPSGAGALRANLEVWPGLQE